MNDTIPIVMTEMTDPVELAKARRRWAQADRNSAWLQAHVPEIYMQHRGKCICVASEELFVADTPEEAFRRAKAAHPDDEGALSRYIPKQKVQRIYATSRTVASPR
jgi:hypothetical protein